MSTRRQATLALAALTLVGSHRATAQRAATPAIAYLRRVDPVAADFAAFNDGLRALGYEDGRTIRIEQRYAGGSLDRLRALARELAAMNVQLFVVDGTLTAEAVLAVTASTTIPVISVILSDPARLGILNVNRPGGRVTGLSALIDDLYEKRLELLRELVPAATRIAVLRNPSNASPIAARVMSQTASRLGFSLRVYDAPDPSAWPGAFAAMAADRCEALLQAADATFFNRPREAVDLALAKRLPAVYPERVFVDAGGLASYGIDYASHWRRAATFVDRILKGARPGELAIEQPTRFELALNLRAADALGLKLQPPLITRADAVVR